LSSLHTRIKYFLLSGIIFQGSDGWRIPVKTNYGHLQIFAWRASSIPTAMHNQTQLGPNVENENLEMVLNTTTENVFVQVWVSVNVLNGI
jgi:hypothetical protein